MSQVCLVAAARTPQGRFMGSLAQHTAVELGAHAARAALASIPPDAVDQVIVGNVLAAGQGMNMARQIAIAAGVPLDRHAFTVNMMCASGLQALLLAAQAIRAGDARVVLCGGAESMSNAPYLLPRARTGYRLGDGTLVDAMLHDGLVDAFDRQHMGLLVEELARTMNITRDQQDAFALLSQQRTAAAAAQGVFTRQIAPVGELTSDEPPRADTTLARLASLKPAFGRDGSITAGNASSISDGAAMLVVCDAAVAEQRNWPVLARIEAGCSVGCEPRKMGLGPVHAIRKLLAQQQASLDQFDAIEINEAFAAQTLACLRELQLDPQQVNAQGGAIAQGHPIGASGARLAVHLAHQLASGQSQRALASLCVGGGMGIAVSLARA